MGGQKLKGNVERGLGGQKLKGNVERGLGGQKLKGGWGLRYAMGLEGLGRKQKGARQCSRCLDTSY